MICKKNALSYFIWIIFTMCNVAVFSFGGMLLAKALGAPMVITAIGFVVGFFGLLLLVSFLINFLSKKVVSKREEAQKSFKIRKRLIFEGIVAVSFFAIGIILRICFLPYAGESAAYFDVAKVTQDNTSMLVPVQNSVYYYLGLLRILFLLIGNQWIAGIWLQIALQIVGGIFLYFAVRKLAGVWASVITLGYLMFAPSSITLSLNYGPDVLYFLLWSVGLLAVSGLIPSEKDVAEKEGIWYGIRMWISSVFVGAVIGFLTYVDILGIVLLLPLIMLPVFRKTSKRKWTWTIRMLLGVLIAAGTFFGVIFLDGMLSNVGFERVMGAWIQTFQPEVPNIYILLLSSTVEIVVLLVFMSFNIFAFLGNRQQDRLTAWILMVYAVAGIYVFGISTSGMTGRNILLILMCISGIAGFRELFRVPRQELESSSEEEKTAMTKEETASYYESFRVSAEGNAAKKVDIEYIENPLPLPKVHVKKTMDYAIVPLEMYMKYDIEVPDTDDFDV